MLHSLAHRPSRPLIVAFVVLLLAAVAAASLIWRLEQDDRWEQRARASNLALDHAHTLQRGIERALSATYALEALLRQGNGTISNFDAVGRQMLPLYPGISSMSLAPAGIIRRVVPLAGNEMAIGLDLLTYSRTKKEASIARDTGKLTLTGPFKLEKGKLAAIGRLPIFLDDANGNPSFWGFINAEIGFPEALEVANLAQLAAQGFDYELWRIDPDTGQKLIISASSSAALNEPLEHTLEVPNATWTLSIVPIKGWSDPLGLSLKAALGLLFSLLLAFVAKLLVELRAHKQGLEALVAQRTAEVQARETDLNRAQFIARVGSWALDLTTNEMQWSAETYRIFGVSGGTPLNHDALLQRVHPDDRDAVDQAWQAALKGGRTDIEYRFVVGATIRWVCAQADWQFTEDGTQTRCVGTVQDITERKRAEESLRESEQELRAIFEGALDGILVADAQTRKLLIANAAICSMLGYTHEEIVRIGVSDLHPKQDQLRAIEPFESMLRGEIQLATDIPMIRKDGSVFYADIKAAPIRLGGKDCLLGIFRDITERIRAERGLVESEARFRGLVEQSITGIYIIQDGSLVYVNPRFAEIRGYSSADEVIGRDPLHLIAEKDRGTVAENNRRLLAGEIPSINYSFTALRKDGSSVDVGVHSALATYRGRPAIIGLLQDISEKKRAEEQIQRYIQQLKTAFMSTVEVATTLSEMRDPYTAGHERRVAEIAVAIGAELGFDARRQEGLRVAGYLHDIGKITIPSEILSKPGKLSAIEFQLIQGHARASYDVLKDVEFPWPVAQVALQHHERMDGSGYPQGLKGEAILLDARIMAVADVVEAMSSHRPYRPGLGIDKALAEIERGRGTAYDADAVDACLRLFREGRYQLPV
jgi:PAS domain S-box-containing protein